MILSGITGCQKPADSTSTDHGAAEKSDAPRYPYTDETKEQKDARMKWWREARFGMFIHWGVYAVPAGVYQGEQIPGIGEWIMSTRIPVDEYRSYAKEFNPVHYDPQAWARLAKEAGMRYMVITSKHHDGFALFPSEVTDWDIADASPYGKDLIGPLAEAARAEGLKFGLYFSQAQDWVHPGGIKRRGVWDEKQRGDVDKYFDEIAVQQTREILERYQPDILWWDTPETTTQAQADKLAAQVSVVPGIITNNRLGGNYQGDTETPEQFIPPTGFKDRDFEVCMTMNGTWGYKSWDHNWKSTTDIIQKLCDIASKGGNFLLNIGPKADGTIPQPSIDRLKAVGKWMDVNGEAIYGTTASPFGKFLWGRSTVKMREEGATVYLHIFDWPENGKLEVPGFGSTPESAILMAGRKPLTTTPFPAGEGKGLMIDVPAEAPDSHASVIKIEVKGETDFEKVLPRQAPDGSLALVPQEAYLHSNSKNALKVERVEKIENIGNWFQDKSWVFWKFRISKPGTFKLTTEMAAVADVAFTFQLKDGEKTEAAAPSDGKHKIFVAEEFAALPGYEKSEVAVPATGGEENFKPIELGTLEVKEPGLYVLEIRPVKDQWDRTRLRTIRFVPEK
jgi:alpha-L-fucosidase